MKKGKLVVFEGTDGAGKGTQQQLLIDYFKSSHIRYASLDFPQYYKTIFGKWIGRFLKGDFGKVEEINPYLLIFPYAADRWQARDETNNWLSEGRVVVANRYTGSNAYQAAKLPKAEQDKFIEWSFEMEYEGFGVPREDLVIFLYVPYDVSRKLINNRKRRQYLDKMKQDIHESNEQLMREVEVVYLRFCKKFSHWLKIDCTKNGKILTKDEIHQKILNLLKKKDII